MNMILVRKKMLIAIFLGMLGTLGLAGCESNDGPMEEFGEEVDEAANDAKRGIDDATD